MKVDVACQNSGLDNVLLAKEEGIRQEEMLPTCRVTSNSLLISLLASPSGVSVNKTLQGCEIPECFM